MNSKLIQLVFIGLLILGLASCTDAPVDEQKSKIQIVTTTTMITDLAKTIGGDDVLVQGLMGAGVDPHLYKATAGDVTKLRDADVIFYNGLHLEGKLEDVFEKMNHNADKTVALSDCLDRSKLIQSENFASNYDPHVWFNINYWQAMTVFLTEKLCELDPTNKANFIQRQDDYLAQLTYLKVSINTKIAALDSEDRILVTAHDAFNYFGKEFSFEVVGLQGLSTATEAGVKDLQLLADFIIKNKVKAIFVESSVPVRTIEALQAAVNSQEHQVIIGGTLFSDALGDPSSAEGTYIGMYQYNVETIINSLK